uniref:Uncharacterized protein n=1 Tax=Zea mays TaxID=4577 RepID=B7ZZA8_MAIZE|nr:unknown [Zea mays]
MYTNQHCKIHRCKKKKTRPPCMTKVNGCLTLSLFCFRDYGRRRLQILGLEEH